MDLFEALDGQDRNWHVEDHGIDLTYNADFLPKEDADRLFQELQELPWHRGAIQTPNGPRDMPRLLTWHADEGLVYKYSGQVHPWAPWTPALTEIRDRLTSVLGVRFNGVLGNLYEDENDSVSPHADDERGLAESVPIASVSLGASRKFVVRHMTTKSRHVTELGHGSLIVMSGNTQKVSQHSIPKMKTVCGPRINLTFRMMGSS